MKNGLNGRHGLGALAAAVLGLTACAKAMPPIEPMEQKTTTEARLRQTVQTLLANEAAGRVRTVEGVGFVTAPIAVPLANGEVSLIPSTPDLEATLAGLWRRWWAGRRQPLPYEAFKTAFRHLTAQRVAVGGAGGEALVRFAQTDDRGGFRFEKVPEGRWLLLADMSSPVSTLLWAVPVDVGAQDPPPVFLVDGNLLLEARKGKADADSR